MKKGVLLVNLGTPDSPEVSDVRKYLREFLLDARVIDISAIGRWLLVNLIIAPFRSFASSKIYKQLWTANGSPLKYYGYQLRQKVADTLGDEYEVELAMRYQSPSIEKGLQALKDKNVSEIIVVPLFPHYASASTGSVYEEVMRITSKWLAIPPIKMIGSFFDNPKMIRVFAENARKHMETTAYDYFVFSYHGIPERQITKAISSCSLGGCCDTLTSKNALCYRAQCFATTRALVAELGLQEGTYTTSFQSRLGRTEWIKPYTDVLIDELSQKGVKNVLAFSPSFVADCLETTIEVGEEYKEAFEHLGGEKWHLVESLNDNNLWVEALSEIILAK